MTTTLETPSRPKYKPYPDYKDSGVEWLGEIPTHWEAARTRFFVESSPQKSEVRYLPSETLVSFVPMESVGEYGGMSLAVTKPLAEVLDGYTYFKDGDVVIAKITPCFENGKGTIVEGLTNGIGFGTTELHVLRPGENIDTQFLFYLTISHSFRHLGAAEMYGAGGQKRVPESFIRDHRIPIIPLSEQTAIANFLDRETAKIDTLIEKKRRLIELLEEKRTALISHAVTKGLDPNAPMKDSGVEWLGEIPAHWGAKRLKFLTSQIIDGTHFTPTYTDTGIPFLRVTDIHTGTIDFDEVKRIPENEHSELISRCKPRKGDLLLSKNGTIGVPCIVSWDEPFSIFVSLCLLKPLPTINVNFMKYFFFSDEIAGQIDSGGKTNTITNLHLDKIREFWFSLPMLPEQTTIAAFLDHETAKIDNLKKKNLEAIAKLREYRTSLISAAVTGKIDVRGVSKSND